MLVFFLQFPYSHLLKRFWHWWLDQLLQMMPEKAYQLLTQTNRFFITFQKDDETITIRYQERGKHLSEPITLPQQEIHIWRGITELPENPLFVLVLVPGQFLRRRIILPKAANENLREVVGFELDRHTPFTAEDVYYTARITDHTSNKDQIIVDVVLTPKNVLNALLIKLKQVGIQLQQVTAVETPDAIPDLGINLLPPQRRFRSHQWRKTLNIGLAGLFVVLLTLALVVPVILHNQTIHSLEEKVNQTRAVAQRINKIKQQAQKLEQQARFVLDKKKATPPLITIMEELSQRLPQDTWLTGLQYRKGQVNIDGKSPAASKLVELLEASPYLKNVHFVSPITQDRSSGLERFRISMDVIYESKPDTDS